MLWMIAYTIALFKRPKFLSSQRVSPDAISPSLGPEKKLEEVRSLVSRDLLQDASNLVEGLYNRDTSIDEISKIYEIAVCGIGEQIDIDGEDFEHEVVRIRRFKNWYYDYPDNSLAAAFYGLALLEAADNLLEARYFDDQGSAEEVIGLREEARRHFAQASSKHTDHWFWRYALFYAVGSRDADLSEVWVLFLNALELQPSSGNLFKLMLEVIYARSPAIEEDLCRLLLIALEHENPRVGALLVNWIFEQCLKRGTKPSMLRVLLPRDKMCAVGDLLDEMEWRSVDAANFHFLAQNWSSFQDASLRLSVDDLGDWYHQRSLQSAIIYAKIIAKFQKN